jgi:hypothetical protein
VKARTGTFASSSCIRVEQFGQEIIIVSSEQ